MKRGFEIDFEKLFDLADKYGQVDAVEHNILATYLLYRNNFDFRKLILHQRLKPKEKLDIILKLPVYKDNVTVFESLIALLLREDKVGQLFYIQDGFSKMVSKRINRDMVQLFTAVPLDDEFRDKIEHKLEKILNKRVMVKATVDPSLLGGAVVKMPDGKIFNFSFSNALSDIKYLITEKN